MESGNLVVGDGFGPATVQSNKGNGILLRTNSIGKFNNSGDQIINNIGWGIFSAGSPANQLIYTSAGSFGTVSRNGAGEISCNVSP